ncbi:MAG TPA: rhomboid family intramembrane serine protease [Pyrinomonadaceae bacterium]|nr:rhomboid family intramembrane serine protease [Pyrinomonadaceae bacterium]
MCRSCGAIVGAGQTTCAVCGASTTSQPTVRAPRDIPDRETVRFARALMERPYKFTIILLMANLFVYLLMWQASGMQFSLVGVFPYPVLIAYGAKLNSLISNGHEWWRFVTPMFIHVNLLHLLVNMYSLWIIGPYVEKLYGATKFVVIWVLTGIAGVVASYLTVVSPDKPLGTLGRFLFKIHDEPSAGASGALFGLVGVLFVFGIKFRHELPEGFKRAFGTGLLPMIVLNLFIGYLARGIIDNAAHLGGLVAGAALAIVVDYRRPGERSGVAIIWQVLRAVALVLVALSFIQIVRHFRDPRPALSQGLPIQIGTKADNFVVYVKAMNEAQEAFYAAIQEDKVDYIPTAVVNLNNAPYLDQKAHELRETIRNMLLEAAGVNPPGAEANKPEEVRQNKAKLIQQFGAWSKDYNEWLRTVGKTYGGLIEQQSEPGK